MKKSFQRIAVFLIVTLVLPFLLPCIPVMKGLTSEEVYAAAAKASLYKKDATIGVAGSPEYIWVTNTKEKATYTYKSANTKIATVTNYGCITGVKKGSTTITVSEKYKGKVTTVGKMKVKVVGAKLGLKNIELGVNEFRYIPIQYSNFKAKYTFKSSNSEVVTMDEYGVLQGLKTGTASISVTETYKGKKTKLGSVKVTVVGASISPDSASISIGVNTDNALTNAVAIIYYNEKAIYTAVADDPSIVACGNKQIYGTDTFVLTGLKAGSTTITVYEEYQGTKNEIGKVKVTVQEIPATNVTFYSDYLTVQDGLPTLEYIIGEPLPATTLRDYFQVEPYNATSTFTFVSSDTAVVTVDSTGMFTPVSPGKAVITVSCGTFSYQIQIVVKEN